jgi:hypothetical protein
MNAVHSIDALDGYPQHEFDQLFHDYHPGPKEHYDVVPEKLAKEEANSFHIMLPQFLWCFTWGLNLSPFVWVMQKGKDQVCVDLSSTISVGETTELLKILVFTLLCYHIPPRYPHYASAGARGYWI